MKMKTFKKIIKWLLISCIAIAAILAIIAVSLSHRINNNESSHLTDITDLETTVSALDGALTLRFSVEDIIFNGERTIAILNYSWNWNKEPMAKRQDTIFITWNGWKLDKYEYQINYFDNSKNVITSEFHNSNDEDLSQYTISFHQNIPLTSKTSSALSGYGQITLESQEAEKKDLYYYISYGHSYLFNSIKIKKRDYKSFSFGSVNAISIEGVAILK